MDTRKYSTAQEDRIVQKFRGLGARKISNSGAGAFSKGDVEICRLDRSGNSAPTNKYLCLVEAKTVTKEQESFSIKKEWLAKLREEAFGMGYSEHALVFDFGDGKDYAVIDISFFEYLMSLLLEETQN